MALSRLTKGGSFGRFVAYLASNIVQKTGQLFLLVGLTYLGTAGDVYRFGLFISLFNLLVPLLSLNIHTSIGRIWFDIADDRQRQNFVLSCLAAGICSVALGLLLLRLGLWGVGFRDELTDGKDAYYAVIFAAMMIFVAFQFFTVLLRLEDRARPFAVFGGITGVGALCTSALAFLAGVPPFLAAVIGYSGAQFIAALYGFASTKRLFNGASLSSTHLRAAYAYSVGTVLFAVVQWANNYAGRWLAADWLSDADLAAYTLLGQFIVALTMSLTTLYESMRPAIMREFAAGDFQAGTRKIDRGFIPSLGFVAVAFLALLALFPLLPAMLPPEYDFRISWIATACFQCVAYAISLRTFWVAVGLRRTTTFAIAAIVGAVINIAGMLALGPVFGVDGLLLAAAFGLLVQAALARVMISRWHRLPTT